MTNYWGKRAYAELSTSPDDLAKRGLVFLMARKFDVAQAGSVSFNLYTNGVPVEIQYYTLINTGETVYAELIESASAVKYGPAIPGRNLNRQFPDTHGVQLQAASAVGGGTVIASELFGSEKALGGSDSSKVHVLAASTNYVMSFANLGNQTSTCHINLAWSEGEPVPFNLVRNIND